MRDVPDLHRSDGCWIGSDSLARISRRRLRPPAGQIRVAYQRDETVITCERTVLVYSRVARSTAPL